MYAFSPANDFSFSGVVRQFMQLGIYFGIVDDVTFYYPARGDQVGYDSFPSSPAKAEISFLGEGLADGFIVKEPGL